MSALEVVGKFFGGLLLLAAILLVLTAIAYCIIRWAIPGGEEWIQPMTDWLSSLFSGAQAPPESEGETVVESATLAESVLRGE